MHRIAVPTLLALSTVVMSCEDNAGRRLILVDADILAEVQDNLDILAADWEKDGAEVEIVSVTDESAADLRSMLQTEHAADRLEGVLLVGDVPYASYQYAVKKMGVDMVKQFPVDFFYMELDGTWIDEKLDTVVDEPSWSNPLSTELIDGTDGIYDKYVGDRVPDIIVGRITPTSQMGDSADVINTYLEKLHNYRMSPPPTRGRAAAPAEAAFYMGPLHNAQTAYAPALDHMYDTVDILGAGTSNPASNALFEDVVSDGYEWMTIWAEGNPKTMTVGGSAVSAYTLGTLEIETDFFLLNSCSVGQFASLDIATKEMMFIDDYVAGRMIFGDPDHGLVAITHTTAGAMYSNHNLFHELMGTGDFTVGGAQLWRLWTSAIDGSFIDSVDLGAVILGDPFLKPHSLD
jgi:hypothetical protein